MDTGQVLFRGVLISSDDLHTISEKEAQEKARRNDRLYCILSALVVIGLIALSAIVYWPGR